MYIDGFGQVVRIPDGPSLDWRSPVGAPPADHPSALPLLRRGVRKDKLS